jgi:hypothetical protein
MIDHDFEALAFAENFSLKELASASAPREGSS